MFVPAWLGADLGAAEAQWEHFVRDKSVRERTAGFSQLVVTTRTEPRRSRTSTTTCNPERRKATLTVASSRARLSSVTSPTKSGSTGPSKLMWDLLRSKPTPRQDWSMKSGAAAAQA